MQPGGRLESRLVHAGSEPEPRTGAVVPPISLATTFAQSEPGQMVLGLYDYSRADNPTRRCFEAALAAAEGAQHCVAFASGCAALSAVVHAVCKTGDKIVCIDDVYGGTQRYLRRQVAPVYGMSTVFVDFKKTDEVKAALVGAKLVWLETPTNPNLEVTDIAAVAQLSRAAGVVLAVDNTFLSPYLQNPLALGADLVVHSCTKSIGGHSDVLMGAVCVNDGALFEALRFHQKSSGAVPSPFDCYLAQRGLKTLHVRMDRSNANAAEVAKFLEKHPKVARVSWPFLDSFPQREIARRQQRGGGMVISFWLKVAKEEDKREASRVFLTSLTVFTCAESLGAVESLAESPSLMTHASVPPDQRKKLGIDDSMMRLSVGIEHVQDLLADIEQALAKVPS
jgi:cystathionine gamma-lyase